MASKGAIASSVASASVISVSIIVVGQITALVEQSRQRIVVADHTKLGAVTSARFTAASS